MTPLAPTHPGTPPPLAEPHAEEPRSRVGRRLLDLDDQPIRFPSDIFCGREAITREEWLRRHALTYGERGAVELRQVVLLAVLTLTALLLGAFLLAGAFDASLGKGLAR